MRKFRLLFITLLISSLLAPQVLAETGTLPDTETPASSPVINSGSASALSTVTSTPSTVYGPGRYTAGTDIPAGEYVVLAQNASVIEGYYTIYADGSEHADIIDINDFDYNAIIYIEDGQVLELDYSSASPIAEIPQIDHTYGEMYKVGYHIPAGTYYILADGSSYSTCGVLSYPSDNFDSVVDFFRVENTASVTVTDGQYLQLSHCSLTDSAVPGSASPGERRPANTETVADSSTSPVITAGSASNGSLGLSTATSAPSTVYPSGTYNVGTDIPAGEYVLLLDHSTAYAAYTIYEDSSEAADFVDYNMFDYNAIIYIENGQSLSLRGCTASPINEVPKIDHFYGTMYKIGYHIPAGTYQLKALDSSSYGIAYVLSYPSDNYDVVENYTYVEDTAAITVNDGQYLQLNDCIISGTAPASSVSKDHGRQTASWYDDWTGAAETAAGDSQRSSLITAGSLVPGLPTVTSSPSTVYQPGTYQAGTDIPAGEYVLFDNGSDDVNSYYYSYESMYIISTVSAPETAEQIVDYGAFDYNSIIQVEEGQFLIMENCTASPISQVTKLDYRKADHFKVGYHIPAGTYHFKANNTYAVAFILSAPSRQYEDIVDYELTYSQGSTFTLTVQEGHYLLLSGCSFTGSNTSSSPGPGGEATDAVTSAYMDYFRQLYGYEEEETTSQVITAPSEGRPLSAATSTPSTVYPEGTYEAGTEIPAGEYMLLCSDTSDSSGSSYSYGGTYIISASRETENYDDIIDYNYFSYNAIIHISEGQFLYLSDCTASPIEEVPQLDYSRGEMYKVGLQLPAGTYRLKQTDTLYSSGRAYILSAPSDNYEDIVESFTVRENEDTVVTVRNGQYLQLKYCIVAEELSSDGSSTGPAFASVEETREIQE